MRLLAAPLALLALAAGPPAAASAASYSAGLELVPLDGGPRTLVVTAPDPSNGFGVPAWSPDGRALTVIGEGRASGGAKLLRYPATSGAPETAAPLAVGYAAQLSPDGTTIAELTDEGLASGRGGLVFRDVATGAVRATIPQWAEGDDLYEQEPGVCWSADGRRAAVAVAERRAGALHVLDLPTGRTLLRRPASLGTPAGPRCFAPDGRRLLLGGGRRLVVVDAETGGARALPTWGRFAEQATWSPDGARIAIGAGGDLAIVDPVSGWGLTHRVGGTAGLAWSPDGRMLAFLVGGGDDSTGDDGPQTLTVVEADRPDQPRVLVRPRRSDLGAFSWSPAGTRIALTTWSSR